MSRNRVQLLLGLAKDKSLCNRSRATQISLLSTESAKGKPPSLNDSSKNTELKVSETKPEQKGKTMAEMDEELRLKLEGISGEGGASGLEYENGKAVAMKRGVKSNMFRLI